MLINLDKARGAVLLILFMGILRLCAAQSTVGGLNGTIVDASGAVISGATVEAVNLGNGDRRTASTNDNGAYSIPNLDPGIYNVSISAPGFTTSTVKDVKVTVSFITSLNLELKPGATSEVVEVTGADAQVQINTTDQQLSTLIDNKKILELPLLSRDPNGLILLSPGVVPTTSALGGFSVNGSRERNNNFQVDGTDNNDTEVPGIPGGLTTPNIDATQEFRVITNNFNAEFGRNTGAIINVVTKSGTNEYHGGLYYYNRSDTFSARDFFDTTGDSDPLHRNQFGGSFGGPLKKDRTFFFGNYEGDRFNIGAAQTRAVPSAAARQGILTNTPFGRIDLSPDSSNNRNGFEFSPTALALINSIYPFGNDPTSAILPGVFDSFRFNYTTRIRSDQFTTRIDHQFNSKHRLSGRYGFDRNDVTGFLPETFPGFGDSVDTLQRSSLFALNLTSILTPNLINEARFGLNRANSPFNGPGNGPSTILQEKIATAFSANGAAVPTLPFGGVNGKGLNLIIGGLSDLGNFDSQSRFTGTTTVADNVTYVRGPHTFKGGVEARYVYANGSNNFVRSEVLDFRLPSIFAFPIIRDNTGRNIPTSGLGSTINDYASFIYGLVGRQTQSQFFDGGGSRTDGDFRGFRVREFDFFFQDNWKVRPNFTLNYGIRYEFKGVPYEVNGLLSTLIDQDPSGFTPQGGFLFRLVGKNSPNENLQLYDDDYNNVAPRFGFAWDPFKDGKTSIRGGYGVFYDRIFGNLISNSTGNLPFTVTFDFFPATVDFDLALVENLPRPVTQQTKFNAVEGDMLFPIIFPVEGSIGNNPYKRDFRNTYSQNYNFGIQREVAKGLVVEADYVGSKGTNIVRFIDGNLTSVRRKNAITGANNPVSTSATRNFLNGSLNTAFFQSALILTTGFSTYNSFTLRVTKTLNSEKFGTGQIQGAYTLGHSIDDSEDPLVAQAGNRNLPRDSSGFEGGFSKPERGESGFDTRQRFVLNFIYDLPFKFENKIVNTVLGNWSMSGIVQVQEGNPFSVFGDVDSQGTAVNARAQFAPPGQGVAPSRDLNPRLQTGPVSSNFRNAPLGQRGDVPRSSFVGPGFAKVDYAITKRFTVAERHQFAVRADFFNLFNRVNLGQPINIITDPRFGQSLAAGQSRIVQFVLRYNF